MLAGLINIWVEIINLTFILRLLNGCFHVNHSLVWLNGKRLASPGYNTLKRSISPLPWRSTADGKVLQVSPSLQPSLQTQDPLLVMTMADNLLQELASSVARGYTEVEGDQSSYSVPTGDSVVISVTQWNWHTRPSFFALAFHNRLEQHNTDGHVPAPVTALHRIEIWWTLVQ